VAIVAALRQLPYEQRVAIVLHHLAGLSVVDVARELKIPVGTVKARLWRGRARWRRCWRPKINYRRPASSRDRGPVGDRAPGIPTHRRRGEVSDERAVGDPAAAAA
jgi:RNA polymerase sigma-70 factor (ECF subfamily)